jgi:PBP1b-binding outer membrane lipoprotein LpoB
MKSKLKSLLSVLALTIFAAGCATQKPVPPLPASCPQPVQLPALQKLPDSVIQPSFLSELETVLFISPSAPTASDFSLRPAKPATSGLGMR